MTREHQVLLTAVGAAVRSLREERGFSRRELAGRSGVSERFLADLESGQGDISVVWLQASADDHWQRVLEQGDVRPSAASPHAREELRALLKAREPLYAQAELAVDTSRLGIDGAVEEIARKVA